MTAAAIALARSAWVRVAVSSDTIALAGLAVVAGGLAAATWGTWGDLDSDTGYDVVAGARVAHGDLPYADFTYYYGPLAPALTGLAALVGGSGFGPAIAVGIVVAGAIILATYALARVLLPPLGAFLASSITAAVAFIPNNYSFVLPHTFAATLGTLFLLLFLLALSRFARSEETLWLLAAGAALGLLPLTKPEVTAAGFVAAGVWLFLRARTGKRIRREAALLFGPALAIPAAVYGAFLIAVSPHRLLVENLYPVDALKAGGNTLVKARMPLTAESFAVLAGRLALYAAGVAAILVAARAIAHGGRQRTAAIGACSLAGALIVAVSVAKPDGLRDGLYYIYGWIPAGAAIALAVLFVRFRGRRNGRWFFEHQLEVALVAALAVVAATTYGAFVFHGYRPQMAVYYAPLAAIFIARLHLVELARSRPAFVLGALWIAFLAAAGTGLSLKDARAESVTVTGVGGSLAETPAEGAVYQSALTAIETKTRPNEPIFVGPLLTGLYTLSGHESPLREISLLPGALPTVQDERKAISRLESARVRLIITDDREWKGYGQTSFGESFDRVLAGWIRSNFDQVATIPAGNARSLHVWLRNAA
jgi:4-amino-4-deoxy-L-arabinose transferase-like glycosyltransferase